MLLALEFALILVGGLLAGHIAGRFRIPKVTTYLLWGLCIGPMAKHFFGISVIRPENHDFLFLFSEVALALIMFNLGGELTGRRLRKFSGRLIRTCLLAGSVVFTLVTLGTRLAGADWSVAFLLGSMALSTAPAATLLVIKEYQSRGHLTDTILGLTTLNVLFCLGLYKLVLVGITVLEGSTPGFAGLGRELLSLLWYFGGSLGVGLGIGLLLSILEQRRRDDSDDFYLVYFGCVLLGIGLCRLLDVSTLLALMVSGMTVLNSFYEGEEVFDRLKNMGRPLYVIFFVLAGADLHLGVLAEMGLIGAAYIVMRSVGEIVGVYFAARVTRCEDDVARYGGVSLLCHASVPLGLLLILQQERPDLALSVGTVVLSAVAIFELIGPLLERWSLIRVGEIEVESFIHHNELGIYRMHLFETANYLVDSVIRHRSHDSPHMTLKVADVMNKRFNTLNESSDMKTIIHLFQTHRRNVQPVFDREGNLVGIICYEDIAQLTYMPSMNYLFVAKDLMRTTWTSVAPDMLFSKALDLLGSMPDRVLVVTDPVRPQKLLGFIEEIDAVTAERRGGRKSD